MKSVAIKIKENRRIFVTASDPRGGKVPSISEESQVNLEKKRAPIKLCSPLGSGSEYEPRHKVVQLCTFPSTTKRYLVHGEDER